MDNLLKDKKKSFKKKKNKHNINDLSNNHIENEDNTNICENNDISIKPYNKWSHAWTSIKANVFMWLACAISVCLFVYSDKHITTNSDHAFYYPILSSLVPYVSAFLSFMLTMYLGYDVHRKTHNRCMKKLYLNSDIPFIVYIRDNLPGLTPYIEWFFSVCDFHIDTHHDTNVNKQPYNIFMEVYQNLLAEGGLAAILIYIFNPTFTIAGYHFIPNITVVIFWSLLYTTVHNINYSILECSEHINHHYFPNTNFGIDLLDIIFETKYEKDSVEVLNHIIPNIIVITALILYIKRFMQ